MPSPYDENSPRQILAETLRTSNQTLMQPYRILAELLLNSCRILANSSLKPSPHQPCETPTKRIRPHETHIGSGDNPEHPPYTALKPFFCSSIHTGFHSQSARHSEQYSTFPQITDIFYSQNRSEICDRMPPCIHRFATYQPSDSGPPTAPPTCPLHTQSQRPRISIRPMANSCNGCNRFPPCSSGSRFICSAAIQNSADMQQT